MFAGVARVRRLETWQRFLMAFIGVTLVLFYFIALTEHDGALAMIELESSSEILVVHQELSEDATLVFLLNRFLQAPEFVVTGRHRAEVLVHNTGCSFPRFWVRLVGDALVSIDFVESEQKQHWTGSLHIPVAGNYSVDARWYGCDEGSTDWEEYESPVSFAAAGPGSVAKRMNVESDLFAKSVWLSTKSSVVQGSGIPAYLWIDPNNQTLSKPAVGEFLKVKKDSKDDGFLVSKSATLTEKNGMYKFSQTGNYEIVCFWGGQTSEDLRSLFLEERKFLSPRQRPFKFHHYNVTNMTHPDSEWTEYERRRSRKCKHIFVSIDDLDQSISQTIFAQQFSAHVHHLVRFLNDTTFPIWILTETEPPMSATTCHSPFIPRTSDHPCNDVIKRLFRDQVFPPQVHLMDNTDVSAPQLDNGHDDVLANVAMRVFVAVGNGVSKWRAMGQHGEIDGLHKNETVEPNFELVAYDWDSKL